MPLSDHEPGHQPGQQAAAPSGPVLVVDFGAQYAQLIARRVRECGVYSEIVPSTTPLEDIMQRKPAAVILSGGPASVYADGAMPAPAGLFEAGLPILGICYGFQLLVRDLGGTVARTGAGEYGATTLERTAVQEADVAAGAGDDDGLLAGLPASSRGWMSHGDNATAPPAGLVVAGRTAATPVAAAEDRGRCLFGVQFHPEVGHTEHGQAILRQFLAAAGCSFDWTTANIIEEQVEQVRATVGDGRAICGLSGGVDSAVAAGPLHRAT